VAACNDLAVRNNDCAHRNLTFSRGSARFGKRGTHANDILV
jgi:hypothetical protein